MNKLTNVFIRILLILTLINQSSLLKSFAQTNTFDLQALGECHFITLSWNPIPNAEFYWIYRGTAPDKIHPMPLTDFPIEATSYVDSNDIVDGQEYFYYISAVNSDKEEFVQSPIVSAKPLCEENKLVPPCKLILKYQVGNTLYWVNEDSHGPMDTAPLILHSRMFLVIRYVTNAIQGTSIAWEGTERKVTIITRSGTHIELWIGKPQARINGKSVPIDPNNAQVVPVIVEGRTLLPLRFVGENLGAKSVEDILWDASTQSVQLFIDDPECEQEGFRYPKAHPLKSNFYEFSVEYHTQSQNLPAVVSLELFKSDNTKTLHLGPSKTIKSKIELDPIKTPKASIEVIKTSFKEAYRYHFRMELEPGILHFYKFVTNEKESLPINGYFGPIYAALPGSERLESLDLDRIDEGTSLTVQGFYTSEPYPMLIPDYWKIHELNINHESRFLIQLEKGQKIQEGAFVCVKAQKRTTSNHVPLLKVSRLIFTQNIQKPKYSAKEIVMAPLLPSFIKQYRFAVIYSGCIDEAVVRDTEDVKHEYRRARADFSGEILNCYKTSFAMGIPKNNIYVNFGRGDHEIDYICADDGDGNPFDFDWDDAEYRNTMERDAERWWRMDDGWRLRTGTRAALYVSIQQINNKIKELPNDVTPEVYFFICTHGNSYGLCSYDEGGLYYNDLVSKIAPLMENSSLSLHARTKIRFSNNTCKAGAIVSHVNDNFRLSGLDYFQLAVSSRSDELSWGRWPDHEVSSYATAGGTFGIPFRASLIEQAQSNSDREVDWKVAYDYASIHDVYVSGVEHERDDGSTVMVYVNPQYWHSRDRSFYQRGPAFEEPLPPEDEIRTSLCRIGVDTSEAIFDVCNCSMSRSIHDYPQTTFTVVNRGIVPFRVVDIIADESVLSKANTSPSFIFRANDHDSCREQYPFLIQLNYNQSHEFNICLQNQNLNAQPLDENGYMLTENNLPVFIDVPITVVYQTGSSQYSQRASVPIRVRAEAYQIRYETSVKRSETIKGKFTHWEQLETKCKIIPAIDGLSEGVLAGPNNSGDFHMSISTDVFKRPPEHQLSYDYMQVFKLEFIFDFMGENKDCIYETYDAGWGRVISASLPPKLKGKMEVSYPPVSSTKKITILIMPEAHSRDGLQSIIGKHTFQFNIRRIARYNCEYGARAISDTHLTIDLEFTDPENVG